MQKRSKDKDMLKFEDASVQKQHPVTKKFVRIDKKSGRVLDESQVNKPFSGVEDRTRKL